jgi:hypothetical protein
MTASFLGTIAGWIAQAVAGAALLTSENVSALQGFFGFLLLGFVVFALFFAFSFSRPQVWRAWSGSAVK